jgi:hypothetical protein
MASFQRREVQYMKLNTIRNGVVSEVAAGEPPINKMRKTRSLLI